MKNRIQIFFFALFSIALLPFTAVAAEEPPAIAAFLDAMQQSVQGYSRAKYDSLEPDGDGGGVLRNVSWSVTRPNTTMTVKVEKIVISGVSQRANGSYAIERIASENGSMTNDIPNVGPMKIVVPSSVVQNIYLLPKQADGSDYRAFTGPMVYELSSTPLITLNVAGQSFDAKNFVAKWSGDPDTGFGKWQTTLESLIIPVDSIPNPEFQKDMKEKLGFEQFELSFDGSATLSGKDNKVAFAYGFRLSGKQIGDIEIALAAQDVPTALAAMVKELQNGAKPNMGKLMPLVIGVKIAKLKLRFVDNDFTKKMLDFAAEKEGTTVEAMTSGGAALIQVGLMQLNLPDFSKSVVAAYNAFVTDPQNISIDISPENPVALATLMGMISAPAVAIQTLGVKVEANK